MKIAVIGAGGVGGYFGARLQAAGEQVVFIQRGPHGEAMRHGGLSIASPARETSNCRRCGVKRMRVASALSTWFW